MESTDEQIKSLIRGRFSPASITKFIREAFVSDRSRIETLADNLHKMPGYESNHHSKIRIILGRVSEELGLDRHSIRLIDGGYKVVLANRRHSPKHTIRCEVLRSIEKAKQLSLDERADLLREIRVLLKI